jgi:hypothetical protein
MDTTKLSLRRSKSIAFTFRGFTVEIVHWNFETPDPNTSPEGKGVWNYYLFIRESQVTPEFFTKIWLTPDRVRFAPDSPEHLNYKYYDSILNGLDLHGGITFYDRLGQEVGHRCVKVGCDYNHLWDRDRGFCSESTVIYDAMKSVDSLHVMIEHVAHKLL